MKRLDLGLFRGPAVHTPGDTLLILIPEDERPLLGDAGRVDWRLCGEVSRLLQTGYFGGSLEEAALLPADARLAVARLLLFGTGPARALPGRTLAAAARAAAEKLTGLRAENVALALPGAIDLAADGEVLLTAFARALGEAPAQTFLRILIPESGARERAIEQAYNLAFPHARARGVELTAHIVEADLPASVPPRPSRAAPASLSPEA